MAIPVYAVLFRFSSRGMFTGSALACSAVRPQHSLFPPGFRSPRNERAPAAGARGKIAVFRDFGRGSDALAAAALAGSCSFSAERGCVVRNIFPRKNRGAIGDHGGWEFSENCYPHQRREALETERSHLRSWRKFFVVTKYDCEIRFSGLGISG